jgi:hypothetical protein
MPSTPTAFKRGQTFSFAMKIPDTIEDGFLRSWLPRAQLRKARNTSADGLIAEVSCFWADPKTTRLLTLHHSLTAKWPIGEAELDVVFTSAGGTQIRSRTIKFQIERGITA